MTSNAHSFDVARIREDFPVLHQMVNGKPLVYLDNAATTQKPQAVIDALVRYYSADNSNVHRGVHTLSQRATEDYDSGRSKARQFINAASDEEIIFVKGTTDGINLVAHSYARQHLGEGDEIIISTMEHHSNIIPWQVLCQEKGAHLRVIPISDAGELLMDEYENLLSSRTKLPVDVQTLGCDFYVFSGHKIYGPTGIGVLYGKAELLEAMPPYQLGSDMIKSVTFERTVYNDLPYKFEAGTPNIAGVIGMGAAIDYLTEIGMDRIDNYEHGLLEYGTECLSGIDGVKIVGNAPGKASVLSFVMDCAHPHDIGTILDTEGVAIRTGHHCAQPLMNRYGVPATARASLSFYNTRDEVDLLVKAIDRVIEVFS